MNVQATRIAVPAVLVVALAVVAVILLGGGGADYKIHARFPDTGQIVKGGLVEVAGREVGLVDSIDLADDGVADVTLKITDKKYAPLHDGTFASIRAVGLSSVANRFVELSPGPEDARKIDDGGTLDLSHTRGIVDLDELLDTLDEKTRGDLQEIIASLARGLSAPTDRQLNAVLGYLDPAIAQTTALGREITLDQAALTRLVRSAGHTATTLASRPDQLRGAISNTSQVLAQLAANREALGSSLERAPALLKQSTTTLRDLRNTLPALNPVLRELRPAAPGIAKLLKQLVPVTQNALPTFAAVNALLPDAVKALKPLPALAKDAVPALNEGTKALTGLGPILKGLRPYAPELVAGFFEGFGGSTTGYFDANGHYARISFNFGGGGLPGIIPSINGNASGTKTGLLARCPGGATDPAEDRSNPNPQDSCDPSQSLGK